MITLKFVFDKEKVAAAGTTEDALLAPVREHAAKHNIVESKTGVFSKAGEDAYCVVGMIIPKVTETDLRYLDLLKEWTFDVDGEKSDCIKSCREWYQEHGRL